MSDELIRLNGHDNDIKDLRLNQKVINDNVVAIEKGNIRIEINVGTILDTYKIIRNTVITLTVANILMMVYAMMKN